MEENKIINSVLLNANVNDWSLFLLGNLKGNVA